MKNIYNIPISELSVGELVDILKETSASEKKEIIHKEEKRYAYGLKGLGNVLGCSRTRASEIKQSGILDEAISQFGRKIIVDVDLAVKLFKQRYD
ncbi:MAG: DUF3853 family protein [Capnocytophaga sp.]|nr:DUF3853 family protein [Capnocytophaga sp.]